MPTLQEYLSKEARIANEPGSIFLYSNVGFNMLDLLIREVTDQDFCGYMEDEILKPLGMQKSAYGWKDDLGLFIPTGYDLQGRPISPYVYSANASGGLLANVEDIARFVSASMYSPQKPTTPVLKPESIQMIHTPQTGIPGLFGLVADAYGFGHFIERLPDGRRAVWHGGQGHGWMTHFHAVPESGDGIVILTNSQRSWSLIAEVLDDWATWSGVGRIKMSRITYGIVTLQGFIVLIVFVTLWLVYRLVLGLRRGNRRLSLLSHESRLFRMIQFAAGIALIGILVWSATQPYLMITSIFPGVAGKAGAAALGLAVVMVLLALFPKNSH